ncbi:hypothetical protein [Ascidiimonas sp. W6]|uniref:hypothetical protein n=1 Tax=Ascidiimonas meishanensis TaxID=3128903 RepID=UPI0030ECF4B3
MKNSILMFVLLNFSMIAFAATQTELKAEDLDPYLSITLDNQENVNYPPGTSFILQDESGETILNTEELNKVGSYKIIGKHSLYVFPSWKKTPDSFDIENGKVELKKHETYTKKSYATKKYTPSDGNVRIARKMLFGSDKGHQKNVSLVFTNGITFYYRDGNVQAWLNGKELKIEGNYFISSELGLLKVSFNPNTGEVWYVFEKK